MSAIKLTRFCHSYMMGTFGLLEVQDQQFYTVEPPYRDNQQNISCIPEGDYALIPHTSEKHGHTYKLVNMDLNVYTTDTGNGNRFDIIFHVGNTKSDTTGCICPGMNLGFVNEKWAVIRSRIAMDKLRGLWLREKPLRLQIINGKSPC